MDRINLISLIDEEIRRLQEARSLLSGASKDDRNTSKSTIRKAAGQKRRELSAAARAKIAAAQRARWAKHKAKK